MNSDIFVLLKECVRNVHPLSDSPILLIVDGHGSRISKSTTINTS